MTSVRTWDHHPGKPGDVSGNARKVSFSFSVFLMTMESVAGALDLRCSRRREGDLDEEDEDEDDEGASSPPSGPEDDLLLDFFAFFFFFFLSLLFLSSG